MAVPSRMEDRILVLSKLKQTNYATVLTDVNLQAGKRIMPEAAVFGQPDVKRYSTRPLSMTGHDYGIQLQEVERDLQDSLSFPMDTWLGAWATAFAMGLVTSSQPNVGSNPTAWKHIFKPQDPSAGKDMPVTTIYTEAANTANLARRLQSCCVKSLSLEFPASAPGKVSVAVIGSGQVVSGILSTPPSIPTYNFLMSNDMSFLYGTQGSPADISSQIVSGSVKFDFTWNPDDANSRAPGGGLYRSRMWVGQPDITLTFQRFVDDAASTPNDDFFADTIQEVNFTVNGAQIGTGPEKHMVNVRGLAVVPTIVKLGQAGNKSVYQYTFNPDHWLKQGGADVVNVTWQNLETSWFV